MHCKLQATTSYVYQYPWLPHYQHVHLQTTISHRTASSLVLWTGKEREKRWKHIALLEQDSEYNIVTPRLQKGGKFKVQTQDTQ